MLLELPLPLAATHIELSFCITTTNDLENKYNFAVCFASFGCMVRHEMSFSIELDCKLWIDTLGTTQSVCQDHIIARHIMLF